MCLILCVYRICAVAAIGSTEEIRMHGTVLTTTDFCILWACARHVIFQTITR